MTTPGLDYRLSGSLGSLGLAGIFSLALYGCTCGQVLYYLSHYASSDHTYIIFLVILVWMLDTGKTIVDMILLRVHIEDTHSLGYNSALPGGDHRRHWLIFMLPPLLLALVSLASGGQIIMATGLDQVLSRAEAS
ncbi:hypothetical protein DAEQUDRAFT_738744 [Daedalea quercina L-15889]|uniref:Uncharacterized protein n=1 Tax=Daedalea quercina L-15889 TaxID=1314783 RepID=A0A165PL56_9APHY|nr:hypothetical protein DAEQUDRAFT_738744 [Daedalea quercina L-15889]